MDGWCVRGVVPLEAGSLDRYAAAARAGIDVILGFALAIASIAGLI